MKILRRHFNNLFEQELNRAKRDSKSICLIMLDVDMFKLYNDNYGHQKGDFALQEVAKVLKAHARRAGDFAFRLGGEEFGVILTSSDYEQSLQVAESIHLNIEKSAIELWLLL
ncbi:MAG: GGDEF domain-containing protein [Sulfurimonadaceae bacterium]|nr:GGDEF domain-containing protein [Sulfurimonadaceae bacterium]